ncbi:hypothetical protein Pcinc_001528 [Petrolisthes cinctipes]|uniref:DUF4817 domain-containing protein n=1 Tax=Petrolisthes cinctipes TaxID=88211 RepID=A0AAE1GLF1_PETCI|nr:hypothetical protein Pcinc_001528 [Petrolisthes cinctipes]
MERFSNHELADMHMVYGAAQGNGRAAQRIYAATYPLRQTPNHTIFANFHRRLSERGRFSPYMNGGGRQREARTVITEENILEAVAQNPCTSTHAIAAELRLTQSTIWRTLHEQLLYPFHFQQV